MLAGRVRRDDRFGSVLFEPIAKLAGVIGAVGEQTACGSADREQRVGADKIGGVSGGKDEGDRTTEIVSQGVDFRRPPAARGANGVMMSPPFAPAAERCALM